jgi:hypothetical protein
MCIYIRINICIYIHSFAHIHIHLSTYTYMYINMYPIFLGKALFPDEEGGEEEAEGGKTGVLDS